MKAGAVEFVKQREGRFIRKPEKYLLILTKAETLLHFH